jgi:hypothetical protein
MNFITARILFGTLLFGLFLRSCEGPKEGTWKNDQINAAKREDFHTLTDEAFVELKANNSKHMASFLSKELIDSHYTDRTIEHISNSLKGSDYVLLDEYYVVNKWRDADTIKNTAIGINGYNLYYPGTSKEMYMAFFVPKTGDDKWLISLIYSKFDYGWKISSMDVSPYMINGKTAPELFKQAKEKYDKHYLVDAVNTMASADNCLRPVEIWQYPVETEMRDFYAKIMDEANNQLTFPYTIKEVPTQPRIFRIFNKVIPQGTYPMIYYLTRINLKNTVEIKKENDLVRKAIGKVIPGIDQDKKYLLYSAFNKMPSASEEPDSYDVTDKLK